MHRYVRVNVHAPSHSQILREINKNNVISIIDRSARLNRNKQTVPISVANGVDDSAPAGSPNR